MRSGAYRPVDGYFAKATLPVRLGHELVADAFITPLSKALEASGLGRVTAFSTRDDEAGEPEILSIELSLVTDTPRALDHVASLLNDLDAPAGSTIGNAECPEMITFGRSFGLGLYLDRSCTDEQSRLDVVEACTDALEGQGLYQGSVSFGDRTALYFYGDSFNQMRAAVTYVMTTDPACKNAYARRLN